LKISEIKKRKCADWQTGGNVKKEMFRKKSTARFDIHINKRNLKAVAIC